MKPSITFTSPLWTEQHLEVPSVFVASSVLCLEEFARASWRPHYHACTDLSSCNIVFRLRLCRIRNWESITALMTCLLLTEKVGKNFTRITQFDFAQGNCLKKHLPAGPAREDVTLERFWLNSLDFSGNMKASLGIKLQGVSQKISFFEANCSSMHFWLLGITPSKMLWRQRSASFCRLSMHAMNISWTQENKRHEY